MHQQEKLRLMVTHVKNTYNSIHCDAILQTAPLYLPEMYLVRGIAFLQKHRFLWNILPEFSHWCLARRLLVQPFSL